MKRQATMPREAPHEILEQTRLFWNASPCGGQDSFAQRMRHRYSVEPWVRDVLRDVAARHADVVEIGCGQGTDGIVLCSMLPPNGSYIGLDYSDESVNAAHRALAEATTSLPLAVAPTFRRGNAEKLEPADGSVECIYSNGVLHHTANPERAFDEVWRVLAPGGEAFLTLYRKPSLKVGAAKVMRAAQAILGRLLRRDRVLYDLVRRRPGSPLLGTMLLEGVGVPRMAWYSRREIERIFARFEILRLAAVGCNVPRRSPRTGGWTRWGYLWFVHLRKPADVRAGS